MLSAAIPEWSRQTIWIVCVLGFVAGLASALFGIGGGLVVVPLLVLWARFPIKVAVGTSLLAIGVIAAVGAATGALVSPQNLRVGIAALLAVGSLVGAPLGVKLAKAMPDTALRWLLTLFVLASGLRMLGWLPLGDGGDGGGGLFVVEEH